LRDDAIAELRLQFADTIGTFGTAKQRREPGRKRLAATS
jgi:hypothetical protein